MHSQENPPAHRQNQTNYQLNLHSREQNLFECLKMGEKFVYMRVRYHVIKTSRTIHENSKS